MTHRNMLFFNRAKHPFPKSSYRVVLANQRFYASTPCIEDALDICDQLHDKWKLLAFVQRVIMVAPQASLYGSDDIVYDNSARFA